ncbi:radical SAM protein [Thermococcus indicus]|uniref:Radical SAM protein n=1 Tax=Thermococcus indicus TaxID=2586643 RepID=A0A4Y5SKE9_9EURY|nr:radical SAM protein [Thermococcus indicus]QDA30662.1 radical SAM protein [Thermococcus indicus]
MKHSMYNIVIPLTRDGVLVYNGLSGALAKLTPEEYRKYLKLSFGEADKELVENLKRGMFIVPEDFNELEYIIQRYEKIKEDTSRLGLVIAPTMKCNLGCIYCYQNREKFDEYSLMNEKVQTELVNFVETIVKINNVRTLEVLWYGGEPLLGLPVIKNLTEKFMRIGERFNVNYSGGMVTNATLITPKIAEELYKLKIRTFQITLDGDRETHDKKRIYKNGSGTFDRIIEAIKILSSYKGVSIVIRVNVDTEVVRNFEKLLDILENEGLKEKIRIYFSKLEKYEHSSSTWGCYIENTKDYSKLEIRLYEKLIERGFMLNIYPFPRYLPCGAVRKYGNICIDPEGYLYKCWHEIGIVEKSVGHVSSGFNENVGRWIITYTPFDFEDCRGCGLLPVCMGGCPLRAMESKKECIPLTGSIEEYLKMTYMYKTRGARDM